MTRTVFLDDLDGTAAAETVRFGLDGTEFEIDVHQDNADRLRGGLARFIAAARTVSAAPARKGSARRRRGPRGQQPAGPAPEQVRAWAAVQGIEVSERGRIANTVLAQYRNAH